MFLILGRFFLSPLENLRPCAVKRAGWAEQVNNHGREKTGREERNEYWLVYFDHRYLDNTPGIRVTQIWDFHMTQEQLSVGQHNRAD